MRTVKGSVTERPSESADPVPVPGPVWPPTYWERSVRWCLCGGLLPLPCRETDVNPLRPTAPPPPAPPLPPPRLHTHPCLRLSFPPLTSTASSQPSTISTVTRLDTLLLPPFGQSSPPRVLPSLRSAPLLTTGTNIRGRRLNQGAPSDSFFL